MSDSVTSSGPFFGQRLGGQSPKAQDPPKAESCGSGSRPKSNAEQRHTRMRTLRRQLRKYPKDVAWLGKFDNPVTASTQAQAARFLLTKSDKCPRVSVTTVTTRRIKSRSADHPGP